MSETNPWADLKLESVKRNYDEDKKRILETEGDYFIMMCFHYPNNLKEKLDSTVKQFKKSDYDKIQTFFSKIPTTDEFNTFLTTL